MTSTHLLADDTATPAITDEVDAGWLRLSAALTDQLPALAGREDLTVTCHPGAGRGAPGCFIPALATVEVDGDRLGVDPTTCHPDRPSDRDRYPATWGVLVHEAAHAAHTRWTPPAEAAGTAATAAAMLLEETRIEHAQLTRRPGDRHWLRASATRLILTDTITDLDTDPEVTRWAAAHAAGLLLARADVGILDDDEVAPVTAAATATLGSDTLDRLRSIWRAAHAAADDDDEAMLTLGRRWCDTVGADADRPQPGTPTPGDPTGDPAEDDGAPSPLTAAISAALDAVQAADSPPPPTGADRAAERTAEAAARRRADRTADRVFNPDRPHPSRLSGLRPPTPAEQAAARRVARALRQAGQRERTATVTTSATPPGRLRMRDALAADAQRAAGATVTAEPFRRTVRRHVPTPPLRLAVACDVSGSMSGVARPVASAAWILGRAATHVPDAKTATVIFGEHVQPVTHPGRVPAAVREFAAIDCHEKAAEAIDALDSALDLTRPGAARLLVVVSDGHFTHPQRLTTQQRITRLAKSGCGVLWLTPDRLTTPITGATTVTLTDPAATAHLIAAAAARALTVTR